MRDVKVSVLELVQEGNAFGWLPFHETWAQVELKNTRNIFSAVAMAARTVEIILRPQELTLDHSILWGDKQLFITAIDAIEDRHRIRVTAVALDPRICSLTRREYAQDALNRPTIKTESVYSFPAWITEKYRGGGQAQPQLVLETRYVLITPKVVKLRAGETVTVGGKTYMVETPHVLDDHKNEYEVYRSEDA